VEGASVSRWDLAGAGLCVIGAAIIISGPRFG
jgi:drug/metabolite transporter superfamily protein YnfA